jgi:surfactin synthase thioesterase subunit
MPINTRGGKAAAKLVGDHAIPRRLAITSAIHALLADASVALSALAHGGPRTHEQAVRGATGLALPQDVRLPALLGSRTIPEYPGDTVSALLLCIPHAGAGPEVFRAWEALSVPGVHVHPVSLPGRDQRLDEKPFTDAMSCVDAIVDEVSPLLSDDRPTVLFGHCLGALLCFELAARLQSHGGPLQLIASGSSDPWNQREQKIGWIGDDDKFLEAVSRVAGYHDPSMEDPELRKLVLPALRADVLMQEGYRPSVSSPIGVPVIAVRGSRDDIVSRRAAAGWERATTDAFELRELPGDHFYYLKQGQAVVEMALADRSALKEPPAAQGPTARDAVGETTRTDVARELAELWQSLLGVESVGIHDDFFDLGGDSNSGLLMVSHAERQGIVITLRDLFRLRTAEAIANHSVKPEAP